MTNIRLLVIIIQSFFKAGKARIELAELHVTDVVEEYLETIYRLQMKEGDGAKTNDIVRTLGVVPGTVTNTIERLEKEGFLEHEPYRGVKLTEKGRKIALQVVRRHRLSERLLTDLLHVDWSKAHETACKIEHDIADEEIMGKIEEALGNPKTCPHGNPIPSEEEDLEEERHGSKKFSSLADLKPHDTGKVVKIRDEDVHVLQDVSKLGLGPGVSVEVIGKVPTEGLVRIRIDGSTVRTIAEKLASAIDVRLNRATTGDLEGSNKEANRRLTGTTAYGDYES